MDTYFIPTYFFDDSIGSTFLVVDQAPSGYFLLGTNSVNKRVP